MSSNLLSEITKKRESLIHTSTRVTTVEGKTFLEESLQGNLTSVKLLVEKPTCPGFVVDLKPDLQVAEIIPSRLYLGSQDVTQDSDLIRQHEFSHILSVGVCVDSTSRIPKLKYSFIPALDLPNENILSMLDMALPLMKEIIDEGSCLYVHCNAGISRAPTVVIAFLMVHKSLSFQEALALVKEQRPSAKPNAGFMQQLQDLECKIKKEETSQQKEEN